MFPNVLMRAALHGALLFVLTATAASAAPPRDTMHQRMLACTACHNDQGRQGTNAYYPRIAGKPAEYLYNQLRHFRDGRRHYPLMTGLLDNMSDEYLLEIAQYFGKLQAPYPAPEPMTLPPEQAERASALVRQGDAARDLPGCAECHGDALMGVQPAVPGLLGLPTGYIRAQMGAWRSGARPLYAASAPVTEVPFSALQHCPQCMIASGENSPTLAVFCGKPAEYHAVVT